MKLFLIRAWLPAALLAFILISAGTESGNFPLKINDISGIDSPWPMIAGIPFPEGEVKDPSSIRIMEGSIEVPSQVDVAATWRDGSIRWALAGFTASPRGLYRVEFGEGVLRSSYARPIQVSGGADGDFSVDTGVAVYFFDREKLLPEYGWLVSGNSRTLVFNGSGSGAYLVDNSGREARVAGRHANIESRVLKEGPGRFVIYRSGWYVTESGEKLARGEAWLYFAAGTPYFKVTHSLILTEDTNKVWFREYGLEFKTEGTPSDMYCPAGKTGEEKIKKVAREGGQVYMMQDKYPHFAEREYRAAIGKENGSQDTVMEEFDTVGDWAHGDYNGYGLTLVMPFLAERFPKEISFGSGGAKAVFWSGRSGRELDFRTPVLAEEYWQSWVTGIRSRKEINETPSNAQGTARTHDIWILPRAGDYDEESVRKAATAGARPPLAIADPEWLCATGAIGWPSHHEDTENFPAEEQMISDYWRRLVMPMEAFPMNGFISWGCYPDISYHSRGGRVVSGFSRLSGLKEYGLRRVPMLMYARSGKREYFEYGRKFGRFTGDYGMAHWDVPGRDKGAFISTPILRLPLFWQGDTHSHGIIDGEIRHWLNEYYLAGDERSLHLVKAVKEAFDRKGYPSAGLVSVSRILLTLVVLDWDEKAVDASRKFIHSIIDMESENGVKSGGYGPLYKDVRNTYDFLEYYLETGDELVKEAFLKLLDHRYRFDRRYNPIAHRNYDALTYAAAYRITGEERFRSVVEQTVGDALYYSRKHPLSEDLEGLPEDPLEWKGLPPFLGQHEYHNPFIGIPAALNLFAEKGRSGKRTPLAVKSMDTNPAAVLFSHEEGRETRLSLYFTTLRTDIKPAVYPYPENPGNRPVPGIKVKTQKRIQWPERLVVSPHDIYHSFITMPPGTRGGLYILSLGGNEAFTLLEITGGKAALYCPEGFWAPSGSPLQRVGEGAFGRSGEGMPLFFRVPGSLRELDILLAGPAMVKRPDGSVAVEFSDENKGRLKVPVEGAGGIWSIEPYIRSFRGDCSPAFFRLFNVEPVVACGSPRLLPDGTGGKTDMAPVAVPPRLPSLEFLSGIHGKSLWLSGNKTLSFPGGDEIEAGGYSYFPGLRGTVEFWFRAGRSTWEIPLAMFQKIEFPFIRGPHVNLGHSYWKRGGRNVFSMLQAELVSEGSPSGGKGFQSRHFFREGEWVHIAYTWDIREVDGKVEGEVSIFLNGRKQPYRGAPYGVGRLAGLKGFNLSAGGGDIRIGPFDGSMDMLRISDVVRYAEDFIPSKRPPERDKNTRALFLFDGDTEGISAFSGRPVEAR